MAARALPGTRIPRRQLIAYRILSSDLDRKAEITQLSVWDVGLQDTVGSAPMALAARLSEDGRTPILDGSWISEPGSKGDLVSAWTLRGSPHVHRRTDLQSVADALWPSDHADGIARLVGSGAHLAKAGVDSIKALTAVAKAMRDICNEPMAKPDLSAAVTKAIPKQYSAFCAPCGTEHVLEMLFRCSALAAGLGLVPDLKPATLAPLKPTVKTPQRQRGFAALIDSYFTLYGAASTAEIAAHFGTGPSQITADLLPAGLEPISIDGIRSHSTDSVISRIKDADTAAAASVVRLLPPSDPLLQPRERAVLVPDPARAKSLWKAIGSPGAVLANGEIVGSWRPKKSGKKLGITVQQFSSLTADQRRAVEDEAQIVTAVRGADRADVVFDN